MDYTHEEFLEAKRQIESVLHKLQESVKTMEKREKAARLKYQITLAKRRIRAFEIALALIEQELE